MVASAVVSSSRRKISDSPRTSSIAVGSSRRTRPEPECTRATARASATRCHCPPERSRPPGYPLAIGASSGARPRAPALTRALSTTASSLLSGRSARLGEVGGATLSRSESSYRTKSLEDCGHAAAPLREVDVAQVDPVDLDRAGVGVVEATEQLGEGGLAGAVLADHRQARAGRDGQVEPAQDRPGARRVGEGDVAEPDLGCVGGRAARLPARWSSRSRGTSDRVETTQRSRRRHLRLQLVDRDHGGGGAVESPAEPAEGDRARPERRARVGDQALEPELAGRGAGAEDPEEQHVGGEHDDQRQPERPLAKPGGVVLQVVEAEPVGGEPVEQPGGEPEEAHLLGRGRLGGQVVGVVGVAAGGLDLRGVAVLPHPALAEQQVGRDPGREEHQRRPPGEPGEQQRRDDAAEQRDQTGRDELHVEEHRRTGHAEVEVARGRQVVGEVAALKVADAVGIEGGPHQPLVEHRAEPVAEQLADHLVKRRHHLRDNEDDAEPHQWTARLAAALHPADQPAGRHRQPRGHQRASHQEHPPRPGQRWQGAGERAEELPRRRLPRRVRRDAHGSRLGPPGDIRLGQMGAGRGASRRFHAIDRAGQAPAYSRRASVR